MPLIVLIAIGIDPFMTAILSEGYLRKVNERKQAIYQRLAASVPRESTACSKTPGTARSKETVPTPWCKRSGT